eukprot:305005_1
MKTSLSQPINVSLNGGNNAGWEMAEVIKESVDKDSECDNESVCGKESMDNKMYNEAHGFKPKLNSKGKRQPKHKQKKVKKERKPRSVEVSQAALVKDVTAILWTMHSGIIWMISIKHWSHYSKQFLRQCW